MAPSSICPYDQRPISIIATLDGALPRPREEESGTVWTSRAAPVIAKPESPIPRGLLTSARTRLHPCKHSTDIALSLSPLQTKLCRVNFTGSSIVEVPLTTSPSVPLHFMNTKILTSHQFDVIVVGVIFCIVANHNTWPVPAI